MANKFLDTDHPMFRPLWVRVLIVALCLAWALFEFGGLAFLGLPAGSPFWGMLFLAIGLYAAWAFFVTSRPPGGEGKDGPPQQ
jgi:hypothetical protein